MFPTQAFPDAAFSSTFFPTGADSEPGFISALPLPFTSMGYPQDGFLSPLVLPFTALEVPAETHGFLSALVLPFGVVTPAPPPEPPTDVIRGGYSPRELKRPPPWDREDEQTDALGLRDLRDIADILEIMKLWLH